MSNRVQIDKQHPALTNELRQCAERARQAALDAGLEYKTIELVNVLVSIRNRCPSGIDLHVQRATEAGESAQRLTVLSSWAETTLFSDFERAALTIAELVTELPTKSVLDLHYAPAAQALNSEELSAVAWVAIAMNALNRVTRICGKAVAERPDTEENGNGNDATSTGAGQDASDDTVTVTAEVSEAPQADSSDASAEGATVA